MVYVLYEHAIYQVLLEGLKIMIGLIVNTSGVNECTIKVYTRSLIYIMYFQQNFDYSRFLIYFNSFETEENTKSQPSKADGLDKSKRHKKKKKKNKNAEQRKQEV